jgi:hypothetical protein
LTAAPFSAMLAADRRGNARWNLASSTSRKRE